MIRAVVCGALVVSACAGQSFEVASVRQNLTGDTHSDFSISGGNDGARLTTQNVSLLTLIQRAYDVRAYQVAGPDWLRDVKFDVAATLPADTPREKIPAALRALLDGRFKLTLHRETRELPIYALIAAKGGVKLQATAAPDGNSGTWQGRGQYTARNETLAHFSEVLSRQLARPVIDMTDLAGGFDFAVEYAPEDGRAPSDAAGAPSLFTALQEKLGLRLEPRKGSVEMLVIDRVERTPTEN